jgi:hypothetical protein
MGSIIRPLRRISQRERNREIRWHDTVPSGWAMEQRDTTLSHKILEFFYEKMQFFGSHRPGRELREENLPPGYRSLPEQVYGKDYQVLPAERAKKAEKREQL